MSRAAADLMDRLHSMTAQALLEILERGLPVLDKDGNIASWEPPSAAHLSQIIKFLKDNGIEAVPGENDAVEKLRNALPVFDQDDEFAQLPTLPN